MAPDELTDDMDILVAAVEQNTDDLSGTATVEEAQRITANALDEDYQAAVERVATYVDEHCV
ncbi:MAG TPA: hypothetical protein VK507_19325 [Iamia sp.]|nr:hypothetical protein [Iamia sp.]